MDAQIGLEPVVVMSSPSPVNLGRAELLELVRIEDCQKNGPSAPPPNGWALLVGEGRATEAEAIGVHPRERARDCTKPRESREALVGVVVEPLLCPEQGTEAR